MSLPFTYGSVCSGMEAASLAWSPLGWRCAFVSEIEKAPCALLKQRFPDVPNFGDMTKFEDWPDVAIDLLAGGTPCQAFSVAGLRKGLADPRGSLMLTYGAIAKRYRPTWLFWENVPGVLSSDEGRDFGAFLGMLAELGYGFAYRVLDAQFFDLAQRRARVFVVGYLGDWRPPAAVLFEPESLRGDSPPSREAREGIAAPTVVGALQGGGSPRGHGTAGINNQAAANGHIVAWPAEVAPTLDAAFGSKWGLEDQHINNGAGMFVPVGFNHIMGAKANGIGAAEDQSVTLGTRVGGGAIAFDARQSDVIQYGDMSGPLDTDQQSIGVLTLEQRGRADGLNLEWRDDGTANALRGSNGGRAGMGVGAIATAWAVRRLTPRECERLQGAPDDHTLVTYRGKPMADGPRYKMIGNSWAVPCVRWIGERIDLVRSLPPSPNLKEENHV